MTDGFEHVADTPNCLSRSVLSVTPDAAAPLPKALYIATGGDVTLRCVDDQADVMFRNVPAAG